MATSFESVTYDDVSRLLPDLGAGRTSEPARGCLEVHGPDAVEFMQRLCSQDVAALEPGGCTFAAFLDGKGRLQVPVRVLRAGPERLILSAPGSQAASLAELLDRFHFGEKLAITPRESWVGVRALGRPGAAIFAECSPGTGRAGDDQILLAVERSGVAWIECFSAPGTELPGSLGDLPELPAATVEALRILARDPLPTVDWNERSIVLEVGLDDHVSTSKGCYAGQEVVARIHTYGHINRELLRLWVDGEGAPAADTPICDAQGEPLGRITSAVHPPEWGCCLALGYVASAAAAEPVPLTVDGRPARLA